MNMLRATAAIAILLAASTAASAEERTVRGQCRADGCDLFEIVSTVSISRNDEGTIRETRIRSLRESRGGEPRVIGIEDGYVFCSLTRPAIIAVKGGRTMAHLLAPLAPGQTPESIQAEANQNAVYFGACHGAEAGTAAATDPESVASEYGYRVSILVPQQVALAKVDDIMRQQPAERRDRARAPAPRVSEAPSPREVSPHGADAFDDRLDRFLGPGSTARSAGRPDAPYDGPYVDDAWLPPRR
jgi:hypothetical protein